MQENQPQTTNETTLDIHFDEFFILLKKNWRLLLYTTLVCTLLAGFITFFVMERQYRSTIRLFLKPEIIEGSNNNTQISFNNAMVNNYVEILKGNRIQRQAAEKLGVSTKTLKTSLRINHEKDTQIIAISAVTPQPNQSQDFVDTVADIFTNYARNELDVTNITVVDASQLPSVPISPNHQKNLIFGFLVGLFSGLGYLLVKSLLDTRIHNKEEAERYLGIPLLGTVPWFD